MNPETRAREFAADLRGTLYSEHFEHPDPIHNTPTPEEMSMLAVWNRLDKEQRGGLVQRMLSGSSANIATLSGLEALTRGQLGFLLRVARGRQTGPRALAP